MGIISRTWRRRFPDESGGAATQLKHRPDEELFLRALVQTFLDHSLCIAEETPHGRHLVFPSQYRREKDIPHEPDIFVSVLTARRSD